MVFEAPVGVTSPYIANSATGEAATSSTSGDGSSAPVVLTLTLGDVLQSLGQSTSNTIDLSSITDTSLPIIQMDGAYSNRGTRGV